MSAHIELSNLKIEWMTLKGQYRSVFANIEVNWHETCYNLDYGKKKKAVSVNIVIKQNVVSLIVGEESPKLPGGKKLEQTDLQENNPMKNSQRCTHDAPNYPLGFHNSVSERN